MTARPAPRFAFGDPVPDAADLGHVHLIAIGGAGMSAVAMLLLARGLSVSGSDVADGPALASLRSAGARVAVGHAAGQVAGADTVVVSSAVRDDNVELAAARAAGTRVLHRSQALAAVMTGTRRVAVAGANGKTTTTSMLTVALVGSGLDPSFASGAHIAQLGTNAAFGSGDAFVVEADESDGSFLAYHPHVAVVTNVQPDHLDFYGSIEHVREAYSAFARSLVDGGLLVACADDDGARALADEQRDLGVAVVTYGRSAGADLVIGSTLAEGLGTRSVIRHDGAERTLDLMVPGSHNVENACAAYLAATVGLGADPGAVLAALATFTGASRRFEVRGEVRGVRVVDDYAHNAPKVAAVVGTAADLVRAAGAGRLHVVFQPHLYSRTRDFAAEFAAALSRADDVVLLDVYGAREEPVPGVTSALIGDHLRRLADGPRTLEVGLSVPEAVQAVASRCASGDVVLTVGAGDVTALGPLIIDALHDAPGGEGR